MINVCDSSDHALVSDFSISDKLLTTNHVSMILAMKNNNVVQCTHQNINSNLESESLDLSPI